MLQPHNHPSVSPIPLLIAALSGLAISALDTFAIHGEISPILIVLLLLLVTVSLGITSGRRRWIAAGLVWFCLPAAHLIKHLLNLPDSLHPNTYPSILMLAAFSLAVCLGGTAIGAAIHHFAYNSAARIGLDREFS